MRVIYTEELKKLALFCILFVLMGAIFLVAFMSEGDRDMMILGVAMFTVFVGVAIGILFAANRIHKFMPF